MALNCLWSTHDVSCRLFSAPIEWEKKYFDLHFIFLNRNLPCSFNRALYHEYSQCTRFCGHDSLPWKILAPTMPCFPFWHRAKSCHESRVSFCGCNNKWKLFVTDESKKIKAKCLATGDWVERWIRWNENESKSACACWKKTLCFDFFSNSTKAHNAKNEKLFFSV